MRPFGESKRIIHHMQGRFAMRTLIIAALLSAVAMLTLAACGAAESGDSSFGELGADAMSDEGQFVSRAVEVEVERATTADDTLPFSVATPAAEAMEGSSADETNQTIATSGNEEFARGPNPQVSNRVIVRNADVDIESDDPTRAVQSISEVAVRLGGWTVDSEVASSSTRSSITIRVPAEQFEVAMDQIRRIASNWVSSRVDSTDFTEEFTDLNSRIAVLERTIASLTALLNNRQTNSDVEDILEVQREIAAQQTLLETARGRVRFISESAAYSKIEVDVSQTPLPMRVAIDAAIGVALNDPESFTVRFWPPEAHDQYRITWDFGTGGSLLVTDRAIRSSDDDGSFTSAPVTTTFANPDFSQYIGRVTVEASSGSEVARGDANFLINVYELPKLNPLLRVLPADQVAPGETVELTATFNNHEGVRGLRYELALGDGSASQTGEIAAGVNTIEATHQYERYVPWELVPTLTLTGDSDAGEVRETATAYLYMREAPTVQPSTFTPGEVATNAVNVLVAALGYAGNVIIFIAITSPIWLIFVGLILLILWLSRRANRRAAAERGYRPPVDDAPESDDSEGDDSGSQEPERDVTRW